MSNNLESKSVGFGAFVKIVSFLLDINLRAFPHLSLVVVVLCFLEAFTYPGFLNKHFIVDLLDIVFIYLVSGYMAGNSFLLLSQKYKTKLSKGQFGLLKNMYILILPTAAVLVMISYNALSRLGSSLVFRDNALLFPSRIYMGIMIIIYFLWVYYYFVEGKFRKIFKLLGIRNFAILLFAVVLLWRLFLDFRTNLPGIIYNLNSLVFKGGYTYDQKMESQIGPVYNYYMFINKYTPDDALIMHPKQQGQWPDVSNEGFTRYFVFPRNLVSEDLSTNDRMSIDYIMLIGDEKLSDRQYINRWPNFDVPAKKIVLYPFNKYENPIVIFSDYSYSDFKYPHYWGLIEVDKERFKW